MGGLSAYCSVTITPKCSGLKQQACFSLFLWGRNRERLSWEVLAQGSHGAAIGARQPGSWPRLKAFRAGGPTSGMAPHTAVGARPRFLLTWFPKRLLECSRDMALPWVSDQRATKAKTMVTFTTSISDVPHCHFRCSPVY